MSQAEHDTTTAFEILSTVPEGCKVRPIVDQASAPALLPGDWIVVDPSVTELEYGAVYLVRDLDRPMIWQVLEAQTFNTLRGAPAAILAPLNKGVWETPQYRPGPAQIGWIMDNMIGRVVGRYEAADAPAQLVLAA